LVIAWLHQPVAAQPPTPDPHYDPAAAPTPWVDQGTSPVATSSDPTEPVINPSNGAPNGDHKLAAALTLGGIYAGFTTWTYFAWYRKHNPLGQFKWGGDGWLGLQTYAGGADKFGHAWATMSLARVGTELLSQWGGFDRVPSTLVATALSEALFLGVEVKDGFYYEFSFSDATGDTLGALAAVAFSLWPRLDELFDYRVEYWPSTEYRRQFDGGNVNIAEDYSGETYLLALHLGAIRSLREQSWGSWTQFVDVAAGFGTTGYKPDPPSRMLPDYQHHQHLYLGVSLNAQGLFDWMFRGRSEPARKITHGLFEVFNAPFTFVPVIDDSRTPTGAVMMGGA
jgi:hypothetical protein